MSTAIFKKNDLVMNTQGRFTGKRGIVLSVTEDRVIVAGISKFHPSPKVSKSKFAKFFKKKQTEVFVKKMNPIHLFPSGQNVNLGINVDIEKYFGDAEVKKDMKVKLSELFNSNLKNEDAKWIYEAFSPN